MSVNICERICLHQICITITVSLLSAHHLFLVYGSLLELNLCRPTIAYFNTWAQFVSNAFPSQFPRLGFFPLLKFMSHVIRCLSCVFFTTEDLHPFARPSIPPEGRCRFESHLLTKN